MIEAPERNYMSDFNKTRERIITYQPYEMTTEEYLQFVHQLFLELEDLIKAKNADYTAGSGPFANFKTALDFGIDPIAGLANRMGDKFQRIKSYCKQGKLAVAGEGVEDAFKDLIGYSTLALGMLYEQQKKEQK
jgi:hypothetical protein